MRSAGIDKAIGTELVLLFSYRSSTQALKTNAIEAHSLTPG